MYRCNLSQKILLKSKPLYIIGTTTYSENNSNSKSNIDYQIVLHPPTESNIRTTAYVVITSEIIWVWNN